MQVMDNLTTKMWDVCFRKPGATPETVDAYTMNACVSVYADTLKEALILARMKISHDMGVTWTSKVVHVRCVGTYDLLTMDQLDDQKAETVYEEPDMYQAIMNYGD